MKHIFFLLFIMITTLFSKAQNDYYAYYDLVEQAESLYEKGNIDSSFVYYQQAFDKVDFIYSSHILDFIKVCKKLKRKDLAEKYKTTLQTQKANINKEYKSIIDSLFEEDQRVRSKKYNKAVSFYTKFILDSTFVFDRNEYKINIALLDERSKVDSLNMLALRSLIKKYGFPGEKLIGLESYIRAIIILVHYNKDVGNKIMGKTLEEALSKGDLDPHNYKWITGKHDGISRLDEKSKSIILY